MRKSTVLAQYYKGNKVVPRQSIPSAASVQFRKRSRASTTTVTRRLSRKIDSGSKRLSGVVSVASLSALGGDTGRKFTGRKDDDPKNKTRCQGLYFFVHDFTTILFSPLFLRQRNVFYFFMEILAPAVVAFIILAAFTSGVSWTQNRDYKDEAAQRARQMLEFPDITMDDAAVNFRSLHVDPTNRALIFYTPVNDFTSTIMQSALEILGLRDSNLVFKHGEGTSGAVGVQDSRELFERALIHRNERFTHGQPIGVIFEYDPHEVSNLTGVPYNVSYTISNFDESISNTDNVFPFVLPVTTKSWRTPYLTSGFLGMQYAIDESIIRLILEKQKVAEMEAIRNSKMTANARSLIEKDDSNDPLASDDIDADMLTFLIAETLEEIQEEKQRRKEMEEFGEPYHVENIPPSGGGGVGRSLGLDDNSNSKTVTFRRHYMHPISSPSELPSRALRAFSSEHTENEEFRSLFSYVVTYCLVVAYSFMSYFTVRQVAEENVSGMKELLLIHGLPYNVHWTMQFFHALVFRTVTSGLILLALKIDYGYGEVTKLAAADVVYVLIYIHQLSLTFMNYFIANYIKSLRLSGVVAIASCVLSFYLPETFARMKLIGKATDFVVALLFPNWCFRHAMRCLLDHESNEKSLGWDNIMEEENSANKIAVGEGMIRLAFMGMFYFFLAAYTGMPGNARLFDSTSQKWHDIRDWIKKKRELRAQASDGSMSQKQQHDKDEDHDDFTKPPVYEDSDPDKECFVSLRNLCKNYGHHKIALDSLSIDIMHEEITVFLGHSSSGKSTLISILSGMLRPSGGHATINGFDVALHPDKARQFIGVCPQKLLTFNLLTVREHVHMCYKFRGFNSKECNKHTATILSHLKLWNVRTSLPRDLTHDELRRLGIALAIVDAPKILMFDEPTRGMDAMGRREVWDTILSMRHHHTIIVTTNYMDEAEHLADKLALLAHGRLVCYGSLDYLKSQYDTGYFLKIVPFIGSFIDANAVVNFARNVLGPKVQVKRHKRLKDVDTLELELPTKEKDHFADFCDELDKQKDVLNIMKYSIRQVNLNDIFIKICTSVAADGYAVDLYVRRDSAGDIKTVLTSEIPTIPEGVDKKITRVTHFTALLKRSWTIGKTARYTFLFHYIFPLLVVWIVLFQAKLFGDAQGEKPEMAMIPGEFGPDMRILSQINEDDPAISYGGHIGRVLSPYEEQVHKQESVLPKLYENLNGEPGKIGYVKDHNIIAFQFGRSGRDLHFQGYFATGALHSPPIALNLMNNALLSAISESERDYSPNWRAYQVTVKSKPMPHINEHEIEKACGLGCILLAMLMSYAMAFISHTCCILPSTEREVGMKHLIIMCGVETAYYWTSNFIVDIIIMFILSITVMFVFITDFYQTFNSTDVIGALFLIVFLYLMWSGVMYCYYISSVIPKNYNVYNFLAILHLFLGIIPFMWLTISQPEAWLGLASEYTLLLLLPPYTITSALFHFLSNSGRRNTCRNIDSYTQYFCDPKYFRSNQTEIYTEHYGSLSEMHESMRQLDPKAARCCEAWCKSPQGRDYCFHNPLVFDVNAESLNSPGIIADVCALFLQGFLFCGLLVISERRLFYRFRRYILFKFLNPGERRNSTGWGDKENDPKNFRHLKDEAIVVDKILDEEKWPEDVAMVCQNLTKSSASTMIIKDFNLEVKRGDCVAILGRGNSGKSCIAKMIAGDLMPTQGNCVIQNANLLFSRKQYLSRIGYCPQESCLYPSFTGVQMMELIGRLRGIPPSILSTHVNKWISVMGLEEVANDKCKEYGDGIKQKLCVAMALIGEPEIIVLDEPTAGVDPSARERLWCVIEHITQKGFTTIFTTYSTDEAFALADKVVVIAEGAVQCIGTPEEVKNMYAQGHTITFKLRHDVMSSAELMLATEARVVEFKDHVNETYKHIDLLDEHDEMLMFFLRDARLPWAEVFRRGHFLASVHDDIIESYEVTEGGVDDIFVFLTNKYHELSKPRTSDPKELDNDTHHHAHRQSRDVVDVVKELKNAEQRLRRGNGEY